MAHHGDSDGEGRLPGQGLGQAGGAAGDFPLVPIVGPRPMIFSLRAYLVWATTVTVLSN